MDRNGNSKLMDLVESRRDIEFSRYSREQVIRKIGRTTRETTVVFVQEMRTVLPQDHFHGLDSLSRDDVVCCREVRGTSQRRELLLRNR